MSHLSTVWDSAYRDLRVEELEVELSHAFNIERLYINHSLHEQRASKRPLLKIDIVDLDNIEDEVKISMRALAGTKLAYFFAREADIVVNASVFYPEELLPPVVQSKGGPLVPESRRLPPPAAKQ
jgi:hypothetical protein